MKSEKHYVTTDKYDSFDFTIPTADKHDCPTFLFQQLTNTDILIDDCTDH